VRILLAAAGAVLLAVDPSVHTNTMAAAVALAVIGLTGIVEMVVPHDRWLKLEEALSCVAVVFVVGASGGQVTPVTLLWLVAAAVGVLARGGRVGSLGRVLVVGALFSPLLTQGTMTAENIGLALATIALLWPPVASRARPQPSARRTTTPSTTRSPPSFPGAPFATAWTGWPRGLTR